jgi:hypothetical protein
MRGIPYAVFLKALGQVRTVPLAHLDQLYSTTVLHFILDALLCIIPILALIGRNTEVSRPLVGIVKQETVFCVLKLTPVGRILQ